MLIFMVILITEKSALKPAIYMEDAKEFNASI